MNKAFIIETINSSKTWNETERIVFRHNNWNLILRKEESIYSPFTFSISGNKEGTHETIGRRYTSVEDAFLHVLNGFNENATIKNKYDSLDEALEAIE